MNSKNNISKIAKVSMYRLGLYTPLMTDRQLNRLADYAEMLVKSKTKYKTKKSQG